MPPTWSFRSLVVQVVRTANAEGDKVLISLAVALVAGSLCAGLALVACWLARGALASPHAARPARDGLGHARARGRTGTQGRVPRSSRPHRLAAAAGSLAVVWPLVPASGVGVCDSLAAVRRRVSLASGALLPRELFEAARSMARGPRLELFGIVAPMVWPACLRAGLAAAVLSLGELSGGKIVSTPVRGELRRDGVHADALRRHGRSGGAVPAAAGRGPGRRCRLLVPGSVLTAQGFVNQSPHPPTPSPTKGRGGARTLSPPLPCCGRGGRGVRGFQSQAFPSGRRTATPVRALRATASVNSM